MSDTLMRSTKELDALTYNARSVINALNRTVISASSSNGFTVTRAQTPLTLTRPLIYRLFRFYEEWANNGFSKTDNSTTNSFDTILKNHDLIPVTDENGNINTASPTTLSIVVHAKILYLNSNNLANINDNQFWLNLIKQNNNPKLITNSAPIPLNIRTPIFDENMSTTRFLTSESYLFPYSYFALDLLGYSGDGVSHILAGNSWDIDADTYVRISAPEISLGRIDTTSLLKTVARRSGTDSLTFGFDTQARGNNGIAGGLSSIETSPGGIAIGRYAIASNTDSIALGIAPSASGVSSIAIGTNWAVGDLSTAIGGNYNVAGEDIYIFTLQQNGGFRTVSIPGNLTSSYNINDILRLFDFTVTFNNQTQSVFSSPNGDGFPSITANITSVTYDSINNVTIITIDQDINFPITITLPDGVSKPTVDGGSLSIIFKFASNLNVGKWSFVTGINNRSTGEAQTVVGKYNAKVDDALFIVGTGDGIGNSRSNSFVVKTNEVFAYGVTPTSNVDMFLADESYGLNVNKTRSLLKAGVQAVLLSDSGVLLKSGPNYPLAGFSIPSVDSSHLILNGNSAEFNAKTIITIGAGEVDIFNSTSKLSINTNGFILNTPNTTSITSNILNLTSSGAINLSWFKSVGIGSLTLSGQTYGSFATNSNQYSHFIGVVDLSTNPYPAIVITNSYKISNIDRSGFFAVNTVIGYPDTDIDYSTTTGIGDNAGNSKLWLLNLTFKNQKDIGVVPTFEAIQMVWARGAFADEGLYGHIGVRRTSMNSSGTINSGPFGYLAWTSDFTSLTNSLSIMNQNVSPQTANFNITGTGEMGAGLITQIANGGAANLVLNSNYITSGNFLESVNIIAEFGEIFAGKFSFYKIGDFTTGANQTSGMLLTIFNGGEVRNAFSVDNNYAYIYLPKNAQKTPIGGIITVNSTSVNNVSSGETDLHTYTLPANTLYNGNESLEFYNHGLWLGTGNTSKYLTLYYGGTPVWTSAIKYWGTSGQSTWSVRVKFIRVSSTLVGYVEFLSNDPLWDATQMLYDFSHTFIYSGAAIIKTTGTGAASDEITQDFSEIKWMPN